MATPRATKQRALLLGAALAVVAIGGGSVLSFQYSGVQAARRVLEEREEALSDSRRVARRFEQVQAAWLEDQTALRFLESGVSDAAYVPSLLKQLEDLGQETHNRVLGVRPSTQGNRPSRMQQRRDPEAQAAAAEAGDGKGKDEAPTPADPYTLLEIQVRLVGSYDSVQAFLYRLTRFPKIIAVETIQMQPHVEVNAQRREGDHPLLNVEIQLTAFIMKDDAAPALPEVQALALAGVEKP